MCSHPAFQIQPTMKCSLLGVSFVLLFVVLLCDAAEKFWCKFTENGKQTYGFYCDATAADMELYEQQQQFNRTNCIQFSQMQPEMTFVTQLKFHACDFDFLLQQCKRAAFLKAIDISHSKYDRLQFDHDLFGHIKVLNVSHNRLLEISPTLFNRMSKISEIDFSYNSLQRIDAITFANASQLIRIDLSNNNLTTIDDTTFANSTHLQSIDLHRNQIQTLQPLQNIRQLQVIRATENPLTLFDCDDFAKMDTINVSISWNRMKKLNLACKKSTTPFRVISNGTAELVVLHHNAQISLANDSEIHCTAGSMTHIESCTIAGRNKFKNIAQLLECFGAKIKRITLSGKVLDGSSTPTLATAFQRFTELEWLNLKDAALSEFDLRTIQQQTHLLRLDLSQNDLKELKNPSLLLRFNWLREFKISGNQIRNVQEIIASLKDSIKWLDLSDNFVGNVNASTFQRLENLTTLKLSNTSLAMSEDNPFRAIKNLSIFDVSQNNLSAVDFSRLAGTLRQLTRLYAANCRLSNATDLIRYLGEQQLLELDLSGNDLAAEKFTVDTFKRLTKLQHLHLNDANLRTFDFDWLQYNRELRALKLSDNQLHSIEMTTMTVMKGLKRLDLDGNDLVRLNALKRSNVPQLDYLAISKNRFECDHLIQVQQIFAGVKLIGNPLQHQKHGENCYLNAMNRTKRGIDERKIYAISILIAIVFISLAMILVTWFFCCRKPKLTRSEEMLKRIRQSMRESEYFVPNFQIPDDEHYDVDELQDANNDDIYDEISLRKNDYDHLHFDTDPMPFDDDNNDNYLHVGLINGRIASRNVTSRL